MVGQGIISLADAGAALFDARAMVRITIITAAGATATVSRVDTDGASAHTTGSENQFTVAANTHRAEDVSWPFYRISVAGGTCRVAMV